jgi:hypothetical protein
VNITANAVNIDGEFIIQISGTGYLTTTTYGIGTFDFYGGDLHFIGDLENALINLDSGTFYWDG